MKRDRIIIIVVSVLIVVALGFFLYVVVEERGGQIVVPGEEETPAPPDTSELADVPVPETDSVNIPLNVAKPEVVTPARPESEANFRSFSISAENGSFFPDTIIVRQGDTLHVDITAVDQAIDFTQPDYGYTIVIAQGRTETVEFGASASGRFTFFCERCGGPDSGPVGYIVVAPKESN